jgi:hypothetical protein
MPETEEAQNIRLVPISGSRLKWHKQALGNESMSPKDL